MPGSLGDTSLDDLEKLEQIFAQKSQSYKAMRKVVEQPPRVTEEAATPPRVETSTAPDMICQAPRIPSDWTPAEDCESVAEVPELRPIQSHPNEDDDDDEIMERPIFVKQEDEADTPARNTRSQRITLNQEVIYS